MENVNSRCGSNEKPNERYVNERINIGNNQEKVIVASSLSVQSMILHFISWLGKRENERERERETGTLLSSISFFSGLYFVVICGQ